MKIKINEAFLTVAEQVDVETQRGDAHLLGQGLELSYDDNSLAAKFNAARLAKAAIDQCGPLFYEEGGLQFSFLIYYVSDTFIFMFLSSITFYLFMFFY